MVYGLDNAANGFSQPVNDGLSIENGHAPLPQPAQSHTEDFTSRADNSTTNGQHDDLFSSSSGEEFAEFDGISSGSSSHTSRGNNVGAGGNPNPGPIASTSTHEQANAGNNKWSLHQDPLDLLNIPRSAMTTPVSSRSTSAAGRSAQATPNSASARGAGPQPANDSPNAQCATRS